MERIQFGIIGGGWRARFYLNIAKACPERFEIIGVVVRNYEKGQELAKEWGVRVYSDLEQLLQAESPSFMVVLVSWDACPVQLEELALRGVPALSETPPAPDLEGLLALNEKMSRLQARVQVAEQYVMQPMHAAREACIASGQLGTVTQAQVSVAHGYHGISLMRRWLGIGYECAEIRAFTFDSPIVAGPNRQGPPTSEQQTRSSQTIATFRFENGKLGVYDFTGDQYFSWIRSPRVLIRGERGEIVNETMTYLQDYQTVVEVPLLRKDAGLNGNLEGYTHKGILAGERWVYRHETAPARLSDDEIAIASCLLRMHDYVRTGKSFYSLAKASQDHYLSMLMNQAAKSGEAITSEKQPWAIADM